MTKSRKLLGLALLVCFALSALIAVGVYGVGTYRAVAVAEITGVEHYFYNQLTAEQKELYEAMEEMHFNGVFIKGEDYDLVAGRHVTQAQLEAYANGNSAIINDLGAARDAFYTDYADIFYVDFGYLSIRVTQDNQGYHAWLGSGRADTYFVEGITADNVQAAINEYEAKRDSIIAEVQKAKATDNQIKSLGSKELAEQVAKIREAHRRVVKSIVYRQETPYEWETSVDDYSAHVRTPYGAFVKGKALCEGYARAFKVIMDELGVPCVLVNGVYRHGNNQEEVHMWTHVKLLDGSWYAVDPTFDDLNFDDTEKWPKDKHPGIANRTTPLDESLIPDQFKEEVEEENEVYDKEIGIYFTEDYFLKGAAYMNTQHATSPYKSEAEYPFHYPELAEYNFGREVTLAHGGLFEVVQTPHNGSMESTDIYVSVFIDGEWCGYAGAAQKGYYILVRYEGDYLPEKLKNNQDLSHLKDDEYVIERPGANGKPIKDNFDSSTVWAYLNPFYAEAEDMYPSIQEGDGYTVLQDTSKPTGLEFALTTRAPRTYKDVNDLDQIVEMTTFTGDLTMFEARSGFIPVKFGNPNYQPAPHIVKSTPTLTGKLLLSSFDRKRSYNIKVEYDQVLQLIDGATEFQMSVYGVRATGEILKGNHAIKLSEVVDMDSIEYDVGEDLPDGTYRCGWVSFKFTPYEEWAYDNVEYIFNFNLEGKRSHKQVNPATYAVGYECEACCYKAFGYHWNVFAQPRLMEEDDLSKEDWITSDGTDVSKSKDRLALVVTRPSQKQDKAMMNKIGEEFDEDILESFTYNITLTICKAVVINTGMGVRVCVGFPEGFSYTDSMNGVTFKAYHFVRDKWDNIVDVEEIECTVTPLGLVLLCKSFSPFAIVAATSDSADVNTDKTVIVSNTSGGTAYTVVDAEIETKDGKVTKQVEAHMFSVKAEQTQTVTIKANSGYVIESIKIDGKVIESNYESEKTITVAHSDLTASSIIEVNFVAQSVKAQEQERGQKPVVQQVKQAEITIAKKSVSVDAGQQIQVETTVKTYGDANNYQWYKDGKAVAGQNQATLLIEHAETTDAGEYTLQVISSTGSTSVTAESSAIHVGVNPVTESGNGSGKSGLTDAELVILIITLIGVAAVGIFIGVLLNTRKSKKTNKK